MNKKKCTGCLVEKLLGEFYKDRTRKDGYRSRCKVCIGTYNTAYYIENSTKITETTKLNRTINGRGTQSTYAKLAARERTSRWRARDLGVKFEKIDFMEIIKTHKMVCNICSLEITSLSELELDHVIPLSLGGSHTASNVRPAHNKCNWRKKRGYGNLAISYITKILSNS